MQSIVNNKTKKQNRASKIMQHSSACTYCAPNRSIKYMEKYAPKINSDACFKKIL